MKHNYPVGTRFNRLVVLEKNSCVKNNAINYKFICDCGNIKDIGISNVANGKSKSCGCISKEIHRKLKTIHGKSKTPEYRSWCSIKERCYNKKNNRYYRYGGRGIVICDRWLNSFENFISDMGERPSAEYSIERINNDGNYEPSNCKWATIEEQASNKSSNSYLTFKGITDTISGWSRRTGIKRRTLEERVKRWGFDIEKILTKGAIYVF